MLLVAHPGEKSVTSEKLREGRTTAGKGAGRANPRQGCVTYSVILPSRIHLRTRSSKGHLIVPSRWDG